MRIMPAFKAKKIFAERKDSHSPMFLGQVSGSGERKSSWKRSVVCLTEGLVFPAGTPHTWVASNGVVVSCYRGQVNHFHTMWDGDTWYEVPAGYDPEFCVARGTRLGRSRKAMREFLAKFPPIDRCAEAHRLRCMVREGD